MNRDWIQRHRLKFAWLLIAVLLAFLALRAGLAQWRELSQWRGLAEQVRMQTGHELAEQLRLIRTEDHDEGVRAVAERREGNFHRR